MNWFTRLVRYFFPVKRKRLELRCVTYLEGEKLTREGWTIAKEEDRNRHIGWVYLERLEKAS